MDNITIFNPNRIPQLSQNSWKHIDRHILYYIDLFLPCEICGDTTLPRQRCDHGTLICTNHHKDAFHYLDSTNILHKYSPYFPDEIEKNIRKVGKSKICKLCSDFSPLSFSSSTSVSVSVSVSASISASASASCCYLTSLIPVQTNSFFPYRNSTDKFEVLGYKKHLINHCCKHTNRNILAHFSKHHLRKNVVYLKQEKKFYYKSNLTKCTLCSSLYRSAGRFIPIYNTTHTYTCNTCVNYVRTKAPKYIKKYKFKNKASFNLKNIDDKKFLQKTLETYLLIYHKIVHTIKMIKLSDTSTPNSKGTTHINRKFLCDALAILPQIISIYRLLNIEPPVSFNEGYRYNLTYGNITDALQS